MSWKDNLPTNNIYFETDNGILYNGEALETMSKFPAKIFDAIITDPPFGTTACKWDSVIPFNDYVVEQVGKKQRIMYKDEWVLYKASSSYDNIDFLENEFDRRSNIGMWTLLKRIRKDRTPIVLFGSEPFSSALRMSNIKEYKYDWIWNKKLAGNAILAKKQPLKIHEIISVFNSKIYYPQKSKGKMRTKMTGGISTQSTEIISTSKTYQPEYKNDEYYPKSIIKFSTANMRKNRLHPTQKPLELMKYLIKTYTNDDDLVLDFTSGSGTTLLACEQLNRRWIGIEMDEHYCEIAKQRFSDMQLSLQESSEEELATI